jgi:ABC-type molybdenum transport system ATPase subunit/photorepair protein PhrA
MIRRRPFPRSLQYVYSTRRFAGSNAGAGDLKPPIIAIDNATFYRHHPNVHTTSPNPPLFPNLSFNLHSHSEEQEHWAILGASSSGKSSLLEVLRGQHLALPPSSRTFPYLLTEEIKQKDHRLRSPPRAIQYVGFGDRGGGALITTGAGTYLSARYESRREATDFTLDDWLKGQTELNPVEEEAADAKDVAEQKEMLGRVIEDLNLKDLLDLPVGNLSNGQTRRARIARALMGKPEVLLLDEPFQGLDPLTMTKISTLLYRMAKARDPRLLLTLRPQDPIPEWITHLMFLGPDFKVAHQGPKDKVLKELMAVSLLPDLSYVNRTTITEMGKTLTATGIRYNTDKNMNPFGMGLNQGRNKMAKASDLLQKLEGLDIKKSSTTEEAAPELHEGNGEEGPDIDTTHVPPPKEGAQPFVEMTNVKVTYGNRTVLGGGVEGGLNWKVLPGSRWGIFGPNGSGKTTIISLICSDHPQTYALPIKLFGRSRLPTLGQPGISIFDIQSRIGHSSPEIHNFFPKYLSVRRVLESAWAETFLGKPTLTHERDLDVDSCLRWFAGYLNPLAPNPVGPLALSTGSESKSYKDVAALNHLSIGNKRQYEAEKYLESIDTLGWADDVTFGSLPLSSQRLALFLRAIIAKPDLVILDEAFSGMDETLRDRCMLFLAHGEAMQYRFKKGNGRQFSRLDRSDQAKTGYVRFTGLEERQALVCVSHVREEVPTVVREWMRLPEDGKGEIRFGRLSEALTQDVRKWSEIWGVEGQETVKGALQKHLT